MDAQTRSSHGIAPAKHKKPQFAKVPLHLAGLAAKATGGKSFLVWILILHRSLRQQNRTIALPNALLRQYGIDRRTKYRALKRLAAVGLIEVEWRTRKNPVVTLIL
jgi:hypothetical protein